MKTAYVYLIVAITAEVIATTALKATNGFRNLLPSIIVLIGYGISFYSLSLCLKYLPVGIVYAIWSGIGIILVTLLGYLIYNQTIDLPAIIGIGLILTGVLVINLFSQTLVE